MTVDFESTFILMEVLRSTRYMRSGYISVSPIMAYRDASSFEELLLLARVSFREARAELRAAKPFDSVPPDVRPDLGVYSRAPGCEVDVDDRGVDSHVPGCETELEVPGKAGGPPSTGMPALRRAHQTQNSSNNT